MNRIALLLLSLCCVSSADAQIRVVSYNTHGGPRDGIDTILAAIGDETVAGIARPIDILLLQEQSHWLNQFTRHRIHANHLFCVCEEAMQVVLTVIELGDILHKVSVGGREIDGVSVPYPDVKIGDRFIADVEWIDKRAVFRNWRVAGKNE